MKLQLKKSSDLLLRAKKVLPAQTHTFSKGYQSFVEGVYPIFIQRAKGSHFTDVDGNDFIDYMAALGPIILGYSNDAVNESIKEQLKDGTIFSLPHPLEVEAAELMSEIIPGHDMAKFTKTGSDAVTAAVRGAKAISEKDNVAYWGGGGGVWHDWFAVITSNNKGIPKSLKNMIKMFEYNNIESLKKLLDDDKEIGTVCMEPMTFEEPSNNFLENVKKVTHDHDALLVFDEVQTGFRWALGGAQEYFGVEADISAWGKAMANGMPLGAISGKAEFMKVFDDVFYSTTFGGETLSLAAFKTTVKEIQEKKVIQHISEIGTKFSNGFKKIVKENDANITVEGFPCKIKLGFPDKNENDSLLIRSLFCQENIEQGIFFWQGPVFHNYSHSDEDLEKTLNSVEKSIQVIKTVSENGSIDKTLRGKQMNRVLSFPV